MKIHHVGIACDNIEDAIAEFSKYHEVIDKSEIIYDPLQKASLCMIYTNTGLDVEFISGEQVSRLVKKGINYYHLCYEVDNLDDIIEKYLGTGAMMISEPKPATLFGGRRVAFMYLPYGLVEFVEATNEIL